MHICLLCRTFHQYRGGAESYCYMMAKAFAQRGHTVHIVTATGAEKYYLEDMGERVKIHKIPFNTEPFRGAWRIKKIIALNNFRYARVVSKKINEISKKYPLDIIESAEYLAEAFWYARKKKIPLSVRLHGYYGLKEAYENNLLKTNLKLRTTWGMQRYLLQNADLITVVSDDFGNLARKIWNLKNKKIDIIPIGIDQKIFTPNGVKTKELSILFAGRLEETKGIAVIAEAMPLFLKEFPNIKFKFAGADKKRKNGDGTWAEYLLKKFPQENIEILGALPTEELIPHYQNSLIAIFPSSYEAGGTVALEAMACGCATIVTNVGAFRENVRDGLDGILIPPDNPKSLVEAIKKLITDDVLREKISKMAVERITNNFSLDEIAQHTLFRYQDVINNFNKKNHENRH